MLKVFWNYFSQIDPDVIMGHDLVDFTLDVLLTRMSKHNVDNWSRLGRLKRKFMPKLKVCNLLTFLIFSERNRSTFYKKSPAFYNGTRTDWCENSVPPLCFSFTVKHWKICKKYFLAVFEETEEAFESECEFLILSNLNINVVFDL